jgi:hypothetical protein
VITSLIDRRSLRAVVVHRRFYDVGNEQSVRQTEAFLLAGRDAPRG